MFFRKIWHLIPFELRDLIFKFIEVIRYYKHKVLTQGQIKRTKIYAKKLKEIKNTKRGKRCFIIGNGPSLTVEDLELLKGEDTFATNRIFDLFEYTEWRPTYYCCHDDKLIAEVKDKFQNIAKESMCFLSGIVVGSGIELKKNVYLYYVDDPLYLGKYPKFSEDITKKIIGGSTVIYGVAQIAAYMGYKEIYFLGVDHNYVIKRDANGKRRLDAAQSYAKGFKVSTADINFPMIERTTKAYEKLKIFSDAHGIKVRNVTRGGKLEVFERDTLENVLEV